MTQDLLCLLGASHDYESPQVSAMERSENTRERERERLLSVPNLRSGGRSDRWQAGPRYFLHLPPHLYRVSNLIFRRATQNIPTTLSIIVFLCVIIHPEFYLLSLVGEERRDR